MRIQLVVLDMAGTTIRDDDAVNDCLRIALEDHSVVTTRDEINQVMGIAKPVAIRTLLEKRRSGEPVADERVKAVHSSFHHRMLRHYRTSPGVAPMPHAMAALAQLKEAGVRVALDTGFSRAIVDAILERLGWRECGLLDATVASDEVTQGRPHPALLFKAMELTRVRAAEAVAKVGDTPADLGEGMAAGAGLVIGVTNGSHTAHELVRCPHTHLIPDLRWLPELVLKHV